VSETASFKAPIAMLGGIGCFVGAVELARGQYPQRVGDLRGAQWPDQGGEHDSAPIVLVTVVGGNSSEVTGNDANRALRFEASGGVDCDLTVKLTGSPGGPSPGWKEEP